MALARPAGFAAFVTGEAAPFAEAYRTLFSAARSPDSNTDPHSLFFNNVNGIRNQSPLIFAAVRRGDSPDQIRASARRAAGLLDLLYDPGAPPCLRPAHRARPRYAADIPQLVSTGLLKAGDTLIAVHRGTEHRAIILDDGRIKLAGSEPFTSLSSAAAYAKRTTRQRLRIPATSGAPRTAASQRGPRRTDPRRAVIFIRYRCQA